MAEKKQGINFYELGRKSGATTPKTQRSGLQAFVSSIDEKVGGMLKTQQAATAALMAAQPQGVDIQKLDERIRGKATEMLTKNKKIYADAAAVVASGISPQSERYKQAVEAMNKVNSVFENMSNSLESMALGRQDALNRVDKLSKGANQSQLTVHHKLANGSIYDDATFNSDGTMNYVDGNNQTVKWSDYKKIGDQKFTGQNGALALVENARKLAGEKNAPTWENKKQDYVNGISILFGKMGKEETLDFVFADTDFVEAYAKKRGLDVEFLKRNPQGDIAGEGKYDIIADYQADVLKDVENAWINTPKYSQDIKFTPAYYTRLEKAGKIQGDMKALNNDILNSKQFAEQQEELLPQSLNYLQNLMPQAKFKIQDNPDGSKTMMVLQGNINESTGQVDSASFRPVQNILDRNGNYIPLDYNNIESLLIVNGII